MIQLRRINFPLTCQARQPLLSRDAGEIASLHCRHQTTFPNQELSISHFLSRVAKRQVDTMDKRSTLEKCIKTSCYASVLLIFT